MNTTTAAEKLGISVSTIQRWCRTGRIAATKTGRAWTIDPTSLPTHSEEPTVTQESADAYEIEAGAHAIEIYPQRRRFGASRAVRESQPVRWSWCIDGFEHSEVSYATPADAEASAKRQLGLDSSHAACVGCGKAATMNASLGPTCIDCYDSYAD